MLRERVQFASCAGCQNSPATRQYTVVMPLPSHSRENQRNRWVRWCRSAAAGVVVAVAAAGVHAAPPAGSTPASRPREESAGRRIPLHLDRATPREAFDALGRAAGCRFALADGELWVEEGVPVTLSLDDGTFWEAYRELGRQTGYELLDRPFVRPAKAETAGPTLTLRRVDVPAEEVPAATLAAGPLLVRPRRAYLSVPPEQAKRQLVPVQVALEIEVFAEPGLDAVYVSAAALKASDGDGNALSRAAGLDPLAAVADGRGLLLLHFDAPAGPPAAVGPWQALLRLGVAAGRDDLELPLDLISADAVAAERPTTRRARVGQLDLLVAPPRLTITASPDGGPASEQSVAVDVTVPRGRVDASTWFRAYNAVATTPPTLKGDGPAWTRTGGAVVALPSPIRPGEAGTYRLFARFSRVSSDLPTNTILSWPLPSEVSETRELLRWPSPLVVDAERHR